MRWHVSVLLLAVLLAFCLAPTAVVAGFT